MNARNGGCPQWIIFYRAHMPLYSHVAPVASSVFRENLEEAQKTMVTIFQNISQYFTRVDG